MGIKFADNAYGVLGASISTTDTLITLSSGINLFPNLGTDDFFYVTLFDGNNIEVVKCVSTSNATMTVVRDSSISRAWPIGTKIELRITASTLQHIIEPAAAAAPVPGRFLGHSAHFASTLVDIPVGTKLIYYELSGGGGGGNSGYSYFHNSIDTGAEAGGASSFRYHNHLTRVTAAGGLGAQISNSQYIGRTISYLCGAEGGNGGSNTYLSAVTVGDKGDPGHLESGTFIYSVSSSLFVQIGGGGSGGIRGDTIAARKSNGAPGAPGYLLLWYYT